MKVGIAINSNKREKLATYIHGEEDSWWRNDGKIFQCIQCHLENPNLFLPL